MTDGSKKATFAAFAADLGIAVADLVGFRITRSAGMLAESVHSPADTGDQALLFLGGNRARHGATPHDPFGFGRGRDVRAFAIDLVLVSMGGLFAFDEGIPRFPDPLS